MAEGDDAPGRFTPRRLLVIAAVVVVGVWVGWTALAEPELPDFVASGDPLELPAQGSFPAVSTEEIEGILVGLRGQPVVVNI